jgi:hypothetical protein
VRSNQQLTNSNQHQIILYSGSLFSNTCTQQTTSDFDLNQLLKEADETGDINIETEILDFFV